MPARAITNGEDSRRVHSDLGRVLPDPSQRPGRVVDGAVNGVGSLVRHLAGVLRRFQNGLVRTYAAGAAIGAVALLLWFLSRASW